MQIAEGMGPNYQFIRADVAVERNGQPEGMVYPEKRFYPVQQMPTSEAAATKASAAW